MESKATRRKRDDRGNHRFKRFIFNQKSNHQQKPLRTNSIRRTRVMNFEKWTTAEIRKSELVKAFQYGNITWQELMRSIDRLQFNLLK